MTRPVSKGGRRGCRCEPASADQPLFPDAEAADGAKSAWPCACTLNGP